MCSNPSIERTCHGRLRLPCPAAHVERWASQAEAELARFAGKGPSGLVTVAAGVARISRPSLRARPQWRALAPRSLVCVAAGVARTGLPWLRSKPQPCTPALLACSAPSSNAEAVPVNSQRGARAGRCGLHARGSGWFSCSAASRRRMAVATACMATLRNSPSFKRHRATYWEAEASATLAPNPSIERTCHGRLRLPWHAAHVER